MSEKRKPIVSIEVTPTEDDDNYEVLGYVRIGGIKVEIDTDINRVRDFFTKRQQKTARPASGRQPVLRPVEDGK